VTKIPVRATLFSAVCAAPFAFGLLQTGTNAIKTLEANITH